MKFRYWQILPLLLFAAALNAAEIADDDTTEAGSTDKDMCEGQCVNSQHRQSKGRLSRPQVIDLAQRLLDKRETPKIFDDPRTIRERKGP